MARVVVRSQMAPATAGRPGGAVDRSILRRDQASRPRRRGCYSWSIASPACSHSSPRLSRRVRGLRSCLRHARSASSSSL